MVRNLRFLHFLLFGKKSGESVVHFQSGRRCLRALREKPILSSHVVAALVKARTNLTRTSVFLAAPSPALWCPPASDFSPLFLVIRHLAAVLGPPSFANLLPIRVFRGRGTLLRVRGGAAAPPYQSL